MMVENYSPSHPTDDMDIADSDEGAPNDNKDKSLHNEVEQEVDYSVNNWKPINKQGESSVCAKVSLEINTKPKSRNTKRSRSKSVNKRSKRSRSRSGNRSRRSRSTSRNKRSRSRSRNRSSRNDFRNDTSRRDRDLRKPGARSKSPRKRETTKSSHTPENMKEDNIFNKLTVLREMPKDDIPKEKWSYDSEEEVIPKIAKPALDTVQNNHNDKSPFHRQDVGDRISGDCVQRGFLSTITRGFNVPKFRGEIKPRGENYSESEEGNIPCDENNREFEARNKSRGLNNSDLDLRNKSRDTKNDENVERNKLRGANNSKSERENKSITPVRRNIQRTEQPIKREPETNTRVQVSKSIAKPFAADSDEEFGTWGSEQKTNTSTMRNGSLEDMHGETLTNNGEGNDFGQRRGGISGPPNNNQFQRPPGQDRFNNNNSRFPGNFGNNNQQNGPPGPPSDNHIPQSMHPVLTNNYKPPQMPQWAMPPQQMNYPPQPGAPPPFSMDMTVGPPMNMLSQQRPGPPMQMMYPIPFIPPPPPSMPMDNHGPTLTSGNLMAILGDSHHPLNQSSMNINHSNNNNQSTISVGQSINDRLSSIFMNQSGVGMNISNNNNQSAMSMGQNNNNQYSDVNASQSLIGTGHHVNIRQSEHSGNQLPRQPHSVSAIFESSNLIETLMSKAGLSSNNMRLANDKRSTQDSMSVSDTLNIILKTAASSVVSRIAEKNSRPNLVSDNMSMSPPSPPSTTPPPLVQQTRHGNNAMQLQSMGGFVPPPLPCYADVLRPSTNKAAFNPSLNPTTTAKNTDAVPNEEKRNRNDFESKKDWQERVACEVKVFLMPAYVARSIDKNDYKDIMKRSVTKICRSGVMEINSEKIEKFVMSYVEKYSRHRKGKQHNAVSSSKHDLRCD